MSAEPLAVEQLPEWFREHERRLAKAEEDLHFLRNLWALHNYGVRLPYAADRDPRVGLRAVPKPRRSRPGGHL